MVGRNGVYVDRKGHDWDATITRVMEQPISVRQAFFSPYKRVAKTVSESIEKFAGAKNAAGQNALGAAITAVPAAPGAAAAPPAPPAAFDVAKFAGIFAAIGLALGAVGSAITAVVTGFMGLQMWQMPLAIFAALLVVSGPSMILAAMKLRQRNLGPLLDAGGWAINARAKVKHLLRPHADRPRHAAAGRAARPPRSVRSCAALALVHAAPRAHRRRLLGLPHGPPREVARGDHGHDDQHEHEHHDDDHHPGRRAEEVTR